MLSSTFFCFLDGIFDKTWQGTYGEQACYSHNKKSHGLQWLGARTPDGLCVLFFGPIEGRHHDAYLTTACNLVDQTRIISLALALVIASFGDSAFYGFMHEVQHAFKEVPQTTAEQHQLTKDMKPGRICIEWLYGERDCTWKILRNTDAMKVFLSPVKATTVTCGLLTNCMTCLRGSNTSSYFDCAPPELEDYLLL